MSKGARMKALRRAWSRWWGSFAGGRAENELDEEMASHLTMQIESNVREGMSPEEARRAAMIAFGGVSSVKERIRDQRGLPWIEDAWTDLRYAVRTLGKAPGFAAVAVVTLALGIGANTAIFSFMDAILLRSLPVEDPESLVMLKFQRPGTSEGETRGSGNQGKMAIHISGGGSYDGQFSVFPYPAYEVFRARTDLFTSVLAYHSRPETHLSVNRVATLGDCVFVSGSYFQTLGIGASVGRTLTDEDDRPDAALAAVVSLAFARQWFGTPEDALGKAMTVNGVSFTVAGVTPPGFYGVNPEWSPEIYVPLRAFVLTQPARRTGEGQIFTQGSRYWLDVMARLKPGVTRDQARSAMDPVFAEYFRVNSGETDEKARLMVMEGAGGLDSLRYRYSQPLYVLMGMVGLILAIACANIANLLLARASARRKEMAVRLGMGASRWRVIRQLLTESVLLSTAGGALGLLVASWGVKALTALLARGREDFTLRADLNWTVLGVTFAAAVLTGMLFGMAPAWQSTKVDLFPALRGAGSAVTPRRRWLPVNWNRALIVAQVMLSFLLLIGAGLFVRTLSKLQSLELGFNKENLLVVGVYPQQAGYQDQAAVRFHETLRERFATVSGVRGATLAAEGQVDGGTWSLQFTVPGSLTKEERSSTPLLPVGPDYLTTMQIPILVGRDIELADRGRKTIAAVASQSFVKRHFGSENPVGRRVTMNYDGPQEVEIVGVAKDARYGDLQEEPPAMLYVDYRQSPGFMAGMVRVVARTTGDPVQMANTAREIVRQADSGVPVSRVMSQAAEIDGTINQEIVFARLCSIFAGLALLIACVGLYGTTSYNVARRTSEIGIRMALGARRGSVLGMVLREVAVLGLMGLAIGIPVALMASKWVASFLFGLEPNDPVTFGAAFAILLAAALLAGLVPAQRAARVDPMTALRHE